MPRISPVRFAIVGLGMGRNHANAALAAPGTELVAIAEPNQERFDGGLAQMSKGANKATKQALSRVVRFDDYKDMIRSGICEAVSLALPTDMHFAATKFCLSQGVHVICEKPPTTNEAQMRKIARQVEDTGLSYAFVRQQRFDPAKFQVRDMALKGKLGTIYHAESHWLRSRNVPFRGGWGVNKDTGGCVLLDLGIHKIDDAWFCMGNPQPTVAFAGMHCQFDYLSKGKGLSMPYNADDFMCGMIRFDDDATLSLSTSFAGNRVAPKDKNVDGVIGNSEWQDLHIHGSKAGVDVMGRRLIKHHKGGVLASDLPISKTLAKMHTGFVGLFSDMALSIRNGTTPLNSATQALQLMGMLQALKKSAETGRSVAIKPV